MSTSTISPAISGIEEKNQAAWLGSHNSPLIIDEAKYTEPGGGQYVIKVEVAGVGLSDVWAYQGLLRPNLPTIMGRDVAGVVHQTGPNSKYSIGDRVVGLASNGGFQNYALMDDQWTIKLPKHIALQDAVALPSAFATASEALYGHLGIKQPLDERRNKRQETIVVWGATSCIGSNALQLASLAKYNVIAVVDEIGEKQLLELLGADRVLDSTLSDEELIEQLQNWSATKIMLVNDKQLVKCYRVMERLGSQITAVPSTFPSIPNLPSSISMVDCSLVQYTDLVIQLYGEFLPKALARGTFFTSPRPKVIGRGLSALHNAVQAVETAGSFEKVVVFIR